MLSQKEWEESVAWTGIVAGCVVRDKQGKYLLVQEKQPKVYGLWNLPAGYVDKGESIEDAAIREVKEETGYGVELDYKIDIYHEEVARPVKHAFKAHIVSGEPTLQQDEILNVSWFTYDELISMKEGEKLRAPWVVDAINKVQLAGRV